MYIHSNYTLFYFKKEHLFLNQHDTPDQALGMSLPRLLTFTVQNPGRNNIVSSITIIYICTRENMGSCRHSGMLTNSPRKIDKLCLACSQNDGCGWLSWSISVTIRHLKNFIVDKKAHFKWVLPRLVCWQWCNFIVR